MATCGESASDRVTTALTSFSENALYAALEAAATDEGFQLPTTAAKVAFQLTMKLLDESRKSEAVKKEISRWSVIIVAALNSCIPAPTVVMGSKSDTHNILTKAKREQMWSNYHKLICSSSFRDKWVAVLGQPCSTLSQYLSRRMLDQLVLLLFPLPSKEEGPTTLQPELTSAEENALRYAAGYVIHSIKNKVKKGKHPLREALLYGLSDMCLKDDVDNTSENWLNAVDRGGLVHVNHTAFKLFHAIEMELRQHFMISKVEEMDEHYRDKVNTSIIGDVDVQYYMDCVTEDLEEEERKELLQQIVRLYVTVRGFSFTRSWLEMYKQEERKKLQKSKSLRSKLNSKQ